MVATIPVHPPISIDSQDRRGDRKMLGREAPGKAEVTVNEEAQAAARQMDTLHATMSASMRLNQAAGPKLIDQDQRADCRAADPSPRPSGTLAPPAVSNGGGEPCHPRRTAACDTSASRAVHCLINSGPYAGGPVERCRLWGSGRRTWYGMPRRGTGRR